jgi:U3 small nucleolar RNA-associated protein 11
MSLESAFRKVSPRRTHKERAQPAKREKWGLLEKHRDYRERAQSYHRKQRRLKALRQRAAFRNPDEFYYKMISTNNHDGTISLPHPTKFRGADAKQDRHMRKLDAQTLQTKLAHEEAAFDRLAAEFPCAAAGVRALYSRRNGIASAGSHIRFFSSTDEPLSFRNDIASTSGQTRPLVDDQLVNRQQRRNALVEEDLHRRAQHIQRLRTLVQQVWIECQVRGTGAKTKIRDFNGKRAAIYRWRPERKR